MTLTLEQLKACMPDAGERAQIYLPCLNQAMTEYEISTLLRAAMFLAQICHESGSLKYVEEIASGKAYETRVDLGNTPAIDGDGPMFKGAGLLQITGRTNTLACLKALGRPETDRAYLLTPIGASRSAGWYWTILKGLNRLADVGAFGAVTKAINGGYNGLDDRIRHYIRIRKVFGI